MYIHKPLPGALAALTALLLSACGGGGGAATADPSTPPPVVSADPVQTSGTVTGFGSLIVDGIRIDDHKVAAKVELEDGSTQTVELKIGQHVEVQHDANLVATAIKVLAEVQGPVDKVDTAANTLTVVNQTVTINSDARLGPVTVFGQPYASLADVVAGDSVEVHGLLRTDAAGKTSIQATRIEKTAAPAFKRVRGHISEFSASTPPTFRLGDLLVNYANAKVEPTGATLANGVEVLVSIPSGASASNGAYAAQVVRVIDRKTEADGHVAEIGGAASKIDASAKTFVVDGTTINASAAVFDQAGKSFADIKEGMYVVVKGTYNADRSFKALKIVLRGVPTEQSTEVELHGTILHYDGPAYFTVRDMPVNAANAKIDCGTQLQNNLQVVVLGHLAATGQVYATSLKCELPQDGATIVERMGIASEIDTAAKTLSLGMPGEAKIKVHWSDTTVFVNLEGHELYGRMMVVQGTMANGVITATKIKLNN